MRGRVVFHLVLGVVLGGCAGAFPKPPPKDGDPTRYASAFNAAVTEAVVKALSGQAYYAHFGDAAYTMAFAWPPTTCTPEALIAYLAKERACWVLQRRGGLDCRDNNLCMEFRVDPRVSGDRRLWPVIEDALRRPCAHLTSPNELAHPGAPSSLGRSARENYDLLECRSGGVIGRDVSLDENRETLIVRLSRG